MYFDEIGELAPPIGMKSLHIHKIYTLDVFCALTLFSDVDGGLLERRLSLILEEMFPWCWPGPHTDLLTRQQDQKLHRFELFLFSFLVNE